MERPRRPSFKFKCHVVRRGPYRARHIRERERERDSRQSLEHNRLSITSRQIDMSPFILTTCQIVSSWCLLQWKLLSKPKMSHTLACSSQLSPSSAILVFPCISRSPSKTHACLLHKIRAKFWLEKKEWCHRNRFAARYHRRSFLGGWNKSRKMRLPSAGYKTQWTCSFFFVAPYTIPVMRNANPWQWYLTFEQYVSLVLMYKFWNSRRKLDSLLFHVLTGSW